MKLVSASSKDLLLKKLFGALFFKKSIYAGISEWEEYSTNGIQ